MYKEFLPFNISSETLRRCSLTSNDRLTGKSIWENIHLETNKTIQNKFLPYWYSIVDPDARPSGMSNYDDMLLLLRQILFDENHNNV
jgi:hypothetical protein